MPMRSILLISLGFSLVFPVYADIYKYVDEQGRVTYSNLPIKGGKKVELPELSTVPAPKSAPVNSSSSSFPKVEGKTQRDRDDVRRRILEDELKAEEQSLATAQKKLQEAESVRLGDERNYQKFLDRVQPLRDEVDLHTKNVAAIRKEISNVR